MDFSAEEKATVDKAILGFEKRAKNWRRNHAWGLILGLATLALGMVIFVNGFQSHLGSKDESIKRYIDESEQLPNGTERDLWMVGTFRKAAMMLEIRFELYKVAVLDMVMGFLLILGGILVIRFSVMRWNKQPQQLLLARIIRTKWEEEIGKS